MTSLSVKRAFQKETKTKNRYYSIMGQLKSKKMFEFKSVFCF